MFPNVGDTRFSSSRSGILPFEIRERSVEGIRVIKCCFRWTRKSKYGHIVAAGKVCVCVSQRNESDRLAPELETYRLVDGATDKLC